MSSYMHYIVRGMITTSNFSFLTVIIFFETTDPEENSGLRAHIPSEITRTERLYVREYLGKPMIALKQGRTIF